MLSPLYPPVCAGKRINPILLYYFEVSLHMEISSSHVHFCCMPGMMKSKGLV